MRTIAWVLVASFSCLVSADAGQHGPPAPTGKAVVANRYGQNTTPSGTVAKRQGLRTFLRVLRNPGQARRVRLARKAAEAEAREAKEAAEIAAASALVRPRIDELSTALAGVASPSELGPVIDQIRQTLLETRTRLEPDASDALGALAQAGAEALVEETRPELSKPDFSNPTHRARVTNAVGRIGKYAAAIRGNRALSSRAQGETLGPFHLLAALHESVNNARFAALGAGNDDYFAIIRVENAVESAAKSTGHFSRRMKEASEPIFTGDGIW